VITDLSHIGYTVHLDTFSIREGNIVSSFLLIPFTVRRPLWVMLVPGIPHDRAVMGWRGVTRYGSG